MGKVNKELEGVNTLTKLLVNDHWESEKVGIGKLKGKNKVPDLILSTTKATVTAGTRYCC